MLRYRFQSKMFKNLILNQNKICFSMGICGCKYGILMISPRSVKKRKDVMLFFRVYKNVSLFAI